MGEHKEPQHMSAGSYAHHKFVELEQEIRQEVNEMGDQVGDATAPVVGWFGDCEACIFAPLRVVFGTDQGTSNGAEQVDVQQQECADEARNGRAMAHEYPTPSAP